MSFSGTLPVSTTTPQSPACPRGCSWLVELASRRPGSGHQKGERPSPKLICPAAASCEPRPSHQGSLGLRSLWVKMYNLGEKWELSGHTRSSESTATVLHRRSDHSSTVIFLPLNSMKWTPLYTYNPPSCVTKQKRNELFSHLKYKSNFPIPHVTLAPPSHAHKRPLSI